MVVYERRMPASAREHETSAGLASADPSTGVESSGTLRTTGKALIHPQRHNLKNRFELLRTLGEGTYGKVKLAFEKSSGEHVAIKYVKKTRIRDETDLNRIRREIKILSSLRHEHIVNIRQVFEKKDRIVLVMDCAQGGELYDYLNTKRTLDESETRRIFRQIASAVNYFHQNSIVHRDLKLENIILDSNGNVKIADFGLSNYFSHDQVLQTFCGSPLYASPEIVNGKPYHGPEVDVWSLGVVLYTMAYGSMPFESSNLRVLRQQISNGDYAEPAQPCGAAGLIRHMLTVSPARRATMRDVLNHWWINLGHERTPDGRPYDPLPDQPVQQSLFSSEFGQGSRSPPPGLHRVPGSRCARKWAETSFDEDEVLHDIRGTTTSTSFRGEVALASFKNNNNVNNNINTNPAADDSQRRSSSSNWSEVISHGIKEITHRVNQSLAADVTLNKQPSIDETSVFSGDNFNLISSKPEVCVLDRGDVFESEKVVSDSEKPPTIFNSDRKPRRSILKRKGKFSGGDSGCCFMSDDACPKNEEDEPHSAKTLSSDMSSGSDSVFSSPDFAFPSTGTVAESTAANLSSPVADCVVSCPVPATSLPPLCPIHGNQTPLNPTSTAYITFNVQPAVQHTSGSAEQVVPYSDRDNSAIENSAVKTDSVLDTPSTASCTCTFDGPVDLSKVVRRNRKGILRNVGGGGSGVNGGARNSLIEDARKRLSIGSMGSNSSADILDLSYDSGDGEQFTTNVHFSSSAYGSRNRNSLNLESQTLDLQPGDRNSFSLEGEFTALNLEEIQEHNPRQMFYEGNMFDREEAKHVYQQAINICSGHY